jgi:anti-anti-sigma regulatory factor
MFEIIDNDSERVYVLKCDNMASDLRLLEKSTEDFIKSDKRNIIIDMSGQNILCSLLLSALIRIKRELMVQGRSLTINNCNPHIYRCMEMAGLETFFSFSNQSLDTHQ